MKRDLAFKIGPIELHYFRGHPFNRPSDNERTVEIPLGFWFLEQFQNQDVTEVGCVMPYYTWCRHAVYDPYDPHSECIHKDAELCDFKNQNILSISTIEHMGEPEYGNQNIDKEKSWRVLLRIADEANKFLVTFPIGVRRDIELLVEKLPVNPIFMIRENIQNEWIQSCPSLDKFEYGSPFPFANAICVLSNCIQ